MKRQMTSVAWLSLLVTSALWAGPPVVLEGTVGGAPAPQRLLGAVLYDQTDSPAGDYWLSVRADMDLGVGGQWLWSERGVQSGNLFAWENPPDRVAVSVATLDILMRAIYALRCDADDSSD